MCQGFSFDCQTVTFHGFDRMYNHPLESSTSSKIIQRTFSKTLQNITDGGNFHSTDQEIMTCSFISTLSALGPLLK